MSQVFLAYFLTVNLVFAEISVSYGATLTYVPTVCESEIFPDLKNGLNFLVRYTTGTYKMLVLNSGTQVLLFPQS